MEDQETPQLGKECKQELTKFMFEFLQRYLQAEAISEIEIKVKFKREGKEFFLSLNSECVLGPPDSAADPCFDLFPDGSRHWDWQQFG